MVVKILMINILFLSTVRVFDRYDNYSELTRGPLGRTFPANIFLPKCWNSLTELIYYQTCSSLAGPPKEYVEQEEQKNKEKPLKRSQSTYPYRDKHINRFFIFFFASRAESQNAKQSFRLANFAHLHTLARSPLNLEFLQYIACKRGEAHDKIIRNWKNMKKVDWRFWKDRLKSGILVAC